MIVRCFLVLIARQLQIAIADLIGVLIFVAIILFAYRCLVVSAAICDLETGISCRRNFRYKNGFTTAPPRSGQVVPGEATVTHPEENDLHFLSVSSEMLRFGSF